MSGVIYIGDRHVGKTHLAIKLAATSSAQFVQVLNFTEQDLKDKPDIYDRATNNTSPTNNIEGRQLQLKVNLPAPVIVNVDWIDTPGEMWRTYWQKVNTDTWQNFLVSAANAKGIMVILPPHQGLVNSEDFITAKQWCNRFDLWVDFFTEHCRSAEDIVFCINKADLFCTNLVQEAQKLAYKNHGGMSWIERNRYIVDKYFAPVKTKIEKINSIKSGSTVRCFITSINNRYLLELPWIYLATFLDYQHG